MNLHISDCIGMIVLVSNVYVFISVEILRTSLVCVLASYTKSLLRVVGITILAVRKRHPVSYKKETCLNSHVLAMSLVFQAFHPKGWS